MKHAPSFSPRPAAHARRALLHACLVGLMLAVAAACGGTDDQGDTQSGVGGAGGDNTGGDSSAGGDSTNSNGSSMSSSMGGDDSSGSSPAATTGGSTGGCSIMSSNTTCAECLEQKCCMVLNACKAADLFGCYSCLDCFLEGNGPDCCDQDPEQNKNHWLVECVAFNCADECS